MQVDEHVTRHDPRVRTRDRSISTQKHVTLHDVANQTVSTLVVDETRFLNPRDAEIKIPDIQGDSRNLHTKNF